MKQKHFLARLADLEIKPRDLAAKEYEDWVAGLSEEDMLAWSVDVFRFAEALGLSLEQLTQGEIAGNERQFEALDLYAQALWRAYALGPEVKERVSRGNTRYLLELQASDERMERMLDKAALQQEQALERKILLEDIQKMLEDMKSSATEE